MLQLIFFFIAFLKAQNQYCVALDDQLNCKLCILTYRQNGECILPIQKIPYCLIYESDKKCQRCFFGFSVAQDQLSCEKIENEKCVVTNREKECLACDKYIRIHDKKCNSENRIPIQYCLIFTGTEENQICHLCEFGFSVLDSFGNNSQCVQENPEIKNCWKTGYNSNQYCDICQVNYYMDYQKNCVKSEAYEINIFKKARKKYLILALLTILLADQIN